MSVKGKSIVAATDGSRPLATLPVLSVRAAKFPTRTNALKPQGSTFLSLPAAINDETITIGDSAALIAVAARVLRA